MEKQTIPPNTSDKTTNDTLNVLNALRDGKNKQEGNTCTGSVRTYIDASDMTHNDGTGNPFQKIKQKIQVLCLDDEVPCKFHNCEENSCRCK